MKKILFFIAALVLMVSCSSNLPNQFTKLAENVEKNGASFSQEQWDNVSDKFEELMEEYNENINKFTSEQKEEINAAIGKFQAAVVTAGFSQVGDAINEAAKGLEGFLEGLAGDTESDD